MKIKSAMIVISFIILNCTMHLNVYAVQTTSSASKTPSSSQPVQSSTHSSSNSPVSESSSKAPSFATSSTPKPQSQQTPSSKKVETNNYSSVQQSQQTSSQPKQQYTYSSSSEASSAVSSEEQTSSLNLPEVTPEDISSPRTVTSVTYVNSNNSKILGIVACVLIGTGVLIVLIVILSSRKSGGNTFSRKRYRKSGRKKNKHLLADKYYRNIKRR